MNQIEQPCEEQVRKAIAESGPAAAFEELIAANNALLRGSELDCGLEFAAARCAIYTEIMRHWAAEQQETFGYDRPFAVVALGGTGRGEMTPCSDTDFAFLFDDAIEGNAFLLELQRQVIHTDEFKKRCGYVAGVLPFNLDDMPELETVQRNAFLDMKPVYDPDVLEPRFRERIRVTFDPFEHFLHVSSFWRDHWGKPTSTPEQLSGFDIKNDGLRGFLAGIWTLAARDFVHSHDVYRTLADSRDLKAYGFLIRIRSFIHLQRGTLSAPGVTGKHAEDVLRFDDFTAFGGMLGPEAGAEDRFEFDNEVRAQLLSARRRVERFTRGVIARVLVEGREIRSGSAICHGVGGLRDTAASTRVSAVDKSRAALSILLASQRYDLPIDPSELESTFRDAGDWLVPVPELSDLFYETRGSLADSFQFLSQLDGAEDRLFPGHKKFETSLDERVITERTALRGSHEREKIRALEGYLREGLEFLARPRPSSKLADPAHELSIAEETALLDANDLAAVKLALKTKRLPETPDDLKMRQDESLALHERFSSGLSGIPLDEYYARCFRDAGFTNETLELARFLVENRRAFKIGANADLITSELVESFVQLCQTEATLRALFVFTCADRVRWESEERDPARWFNIRELYCKARMAFHPQSDPTAPLSLAGYSREELVILKDFGQPFFEGAYRHYAIRFGMHLVRIAEASSNARPKVSLIRRDSSVILGVATRDYPGIAACISGTLWKHGIELRQAHLFSAANQSIALDFFHLAQGGPVVKTEVLKAIEEAIQERRFINEKDQGELPKVAENISLVGWNTGLFCLRAETSGKLRSVSSLVYELTWKIYRHFGANIFGLAAHTGRDNAYVSVYHNLPGLTLKQGQGIVCKRF